MSLGTVQFMQEDPLQKAKNQLQTSLGKIDHCLTKTPHPDVRKDLIALRDKYNERFRNGEYLPQEIEE